MQYTAEIIQTLRGHGHIVRRSDGSIADVGSHDSRQDAERAGSAAVQQLERNWYRYNAIEQHHADDDRYYGA